MVNLKVIGNVATSTEVVVNTTAATEAARLAAINAELAHVAAAEAVVQATLARDAAEVAAHAAAHTSLIFPGDTNLTCTLTAAATADTFSAWVEIVDSAATKLSAAFATYHGHITELSIESLSEIDTIYMVEISCGAAGEVPLTAIRLAGGTKFDTPSPVQRLAMPAIPAGCKVWYRMKTASAVADTALVNFRYHVDM